MKLKDLDDFIKKLDDWPLKNSQDRLDRGYISYKLGTLRYLLVNKVIEGDKNARSS